MLFAKALVGAAERKADIHSQRSKFWNLDNRVANEAAIPAGLCRMEQSALRQTGIFLGNRAGGILVSFHPSQLEAGHGGPRFPRGQADPRERKP
jgi:hypothetical protein